MVADCRRFYYNSEVEGVDNAPVKIRHLSIGIAAAMTVIKLIITNSLNLIHTKNSVN